MGLRGQGFEVDDWCSAKVETRSEDGDHRVAVA